MKTKWIAVLLAAASLASLSGCKMKSEDGMPIVTTATTATETETTEKAITKATTKATTKTTTTVVTTDPLSIPDTIDDVATVEDVTFSVSSNWKERTEDGIYYWDKSESHYLYVETSTVAQNIDADTYLQQLYDGYKSSSNIEAYNFVEEVSVCGKNGIRFEVITKPDEEGFNREAVVYATVYEGKSYLFSFVDRCGSGYKISDFENDVINSISFSGETNSIDTNDENQSESSDITVGMINALDTAKSYLDFSAFSYQGLIDQLLYEKYTQEEAVYAVDNCGADWNEQAARCAQEYMDYSSFSRQDLIDQLLYEGFTQEQAEYGVQSVGY